MRLELWSAATSWQEGSLADAAVFVHGAMALADKQNAGFPPAELDPYLDLLPPPPGSAEQWLAALVGPGGHMPPSLMRIIADLPAAAVIDEKKEIAVRTEIEFTVSGNGATDNLASAKFPRTRDPGGASRFHYTPIPIWKRSKHGTPGKIQGEVQVRSDGITATALTLSRAARLISDLRGWLGQRIALTAVEWINSYPGRRETISLDRSRLAERQGAADGPVPLIAPHTIGR